MLEYFKQFKKLHECHQKKIILNGVLSDPSIKDITDIGDLNCNITHMLVSNLRETILPMKFEDDFIPKRSSLMMILNRYI